MKVKDLKSIDIFFVNELNANDVVNTFIPQILLSLLLFLSYVNDKYRKEPIRDVSLDEKIKIDHNWLLI